jgi:hypothetical protein
MFKERKLKPRSASRATRLAMIGLARFFDWRDALVIVKPETFIRWHPHGVLHLLALEVSPQRPSAAPKEPA